MINDNLDSLVPSGKGKIFVRYFRLHQEVDENCALLGYYAVSSGNLLSKFWDNLSVPSSRFNK